MRVVQWSMLPALAITGIRAYLTVVGRAYLLLAVIATGAVLNGVLNYALIFGHFGAPALGIVGAAVATAICQPADGGAAAGLHRRCRVAGAVRALRALLAAGLGRLPEILRLGWPIGATIIAEVGLFATSSIMMGWLGTVPLAAHGIALQLASIAFMIPLGLANAATVRVGLAVGRGSARRRRAGGQHRAGARDRDRPESGRRCSGSGRERLIGLFLDAENANTPEVLQYAVPLLLVAAAFQTVDSLQAVASGILRGVKDTRVPMVIAVFSYWGVGLPVAWVLGFGLDWGGVGVWWGLAFGLAVAALLLNARFQLRDRLGLLGA